MGWVDQIGDTSFKPTAITRTLKESESLQAGVKHMYVAPFAERSFSSSNYRYLSLPVYGKLPNYFAEYDYKPPDDVHDGPFQYAHGIKETTFDYWAKDPIVTKIFNTFMTGVRGSRPHWVHWYPVQEELIDGSSGKDDLGGGKGHDLNKFITTFPDAKGRYVLEDLPVVIDDAYDRNPRIEAMKHDFFQEQPIQGISPNPMLVSWFRLVALQLICYSVARRTDIFHASCTP